jgi:hypothetical protein
MLIKVQKRNSSLGLGAFLNLKNALKLNSEA